MYLLKIWIDYGFDGERTISIMCSESKEKLAEQIEVIKNSISSFHEEFMNNSVNLKTELGMLGKAYCDLTKEQNDTFFEKIKVMQSTLVEKHYGPVLGDILINISKSELNDSKFIIEELHLLT